jgi:hypothetical protein
MNKISLAKALKVKKRLGYEISNVRDKINKNNSYNIVNIPKQDIQKLIDRMAYLSSKMLELKVKINTANSGVIDKIFLLEETKGELSFFKALNTKEGLHQSGWGSQESAIFACFINEEEKDDIIKHLVDTIDALQDAVDHYNNTTFVEFEYE